ncbi:MAG: glycosyl hydrolase [Oscillospiraceae bacterium]
MKGANDMFISKFKRIISAALAAVLPLTAAPVIHCSAAELVYEAENATLSGLSVQSGSGYSGGKYVQMGESGSISFTVTITNSGLYSFNFVSSGIGGDKVNYALLDGENIGSFSSKADTLGDACINSVYVEMGTHEVSVQKSWGWIKLDCLKVNQMTAAKDYYKVSKELINPNASESAKRLMSFIADNYGKNVISGQVCDNGINGNEFKAIKNLTGKTPAILGMDLMRYTPSRIKRGDSCKTVENAVEFSQQGGIVTLCWHWNAPDKYLKSGTDSNGNPRWWGGFYTDNVNMDFSAVMDGTDKEGYDLLMSDIDAIAVQLQKLEDADVPVLFRPLHEASGGWFWWGSDGAAPYKKLWKTMYDKLTNEYGLDNLIWVWNGQKDSWYPGDEYVDIIGEDIYPGKRVYTPQSSKFTEAASYTDNTKIVALTENGCLFDIDQALQAGTLWSWFCVWGGEFCSNGTTISETYTEKSMWKSVYGHENVLTLDELPDLKTYPVDNTQTDISKCTVTLSAASYEYSGSAKKPTVTVKEGSAVLTNGTHYSVSYSNNVNIGTATVTVTGKGRFKGSVKKTFKIVPAKVKGFGLDANSPQSIRLKWSKNAGSVTGYQLQRSSGGEWKTVAVTSASPYSVKELSPARAYKFRIRAYKTVGGVKYYGAYSPSFITVTKPLKETITGLTSPKAKYIKLTWKKLSAGSGYQINIALNKSFTSGKKTYWIKDIGTNSKTISGLTSGRTYYVRVRAYRSDLQGTKHYGTWSDVKSIKCR